MLPLTSWAQDDLTLYPGKGVGTVKLNKTTENELRKIYGTNFTLDTSYNNYLLDYSVLGLKFKINPETHKVTVVIAYGNFQGKTEKDIKLETSILGDAYIKYRRRYIMQGKNEIFYVCKKIQFVSRCNCNNMLKITENEADKLPIQEIWIAKTFKLGPVINIE
ncbi:hypothetical protein QNI22_36800 [Cytophagaceae bacterium BD1B2-1]|uniref:Uncharacterized protein n=2 Tax=Xanthocytophaga agilis TaxID=3048010 RepID=A0AAE3R9B7_9BACT|nr:hypothetical protein [Xanthocytophaga agilis]